MVSGKYSNISMVLTYCVYVYYLSNHVNHLFIMNQKITQMAISFKINMYVYMFASLLFIVLVLLF